MTRVALSKLHPAQSDQNWTYLTTYGWRIMVASHQEDHEKGGVDSPQCEPHGLCTGYTIPITSRRYHDQPLCIYSL